MMHEASSYDSNQFLSFTYAPRFLPPKANLRPDDMRLFWKRARRAFGPMRYVAAGEYGERTSRPHYHAIAFGLDLPDLVPKSKNDRGEILYGSKSLDEVWGLGSTKIGAVTFQSCGYVASYMLKDIKSDYARDGTYQFINPKTGESFERLRPFARYSNRPGIGREWIDKYYRDVFPADVVRTVDGPRPVPEYYFKRLEKLDPALYAKVKNKREAAILEPRNIWNSRPSRLQVRKNCKLAKLNLSGRGSRKTSENRNFIPPHKEDIA